MEERAMQQPGTDGQADAEVTSNDTSESDPAFSVDVEGSAGATTISPSGDLDLATATQFWEQVAVLIAPGEHIVIDCRGLTFLDSSGINLLLRARNVCAEHGATLELRSVPPEPRRALEVVGVAELFGVR
jgi:anti-anti-sigma factor